ncbi:NACHT N-terminal Helical domain 1-containing protein [Streptomyces sp. NPDC001415]
MPGLEVVVLRLASTVVSTVAKSVLAPRPGADLAAGPLRPLPKPASPDRLARVLGRRLEESYASLPAHERAAAADAVRDGFAAAGELDADRLFALSLDPDRLAAELRRPHPGPGEPLYEELLTLCCAHYVEQLTAHPSFAARAAVGQVRSADAARELIEDVRDRVGPRPEATALAFEEKYARYVEQTHSRLELFGLTLGRSASEWPLDTAYISLRRFREDEQPMVRVQLGMAWGAFDAAEYVTEVLEPAPDWESTYLTVRTDEQVAQLGRLHGMRRITLAGDHALPDALLSLPRLAHLALTANTVVRDLSPLVRLPALDQLGLDGCPQVRDLGPVCDLPRVRALSLLDLRPGLSLSPLARLDQLTGLMLGTPGETRNLSELPPLERLVVLGLYRQSEGISLDGLERWPGLHTLTITGEAQAKGLARVPVPRKLRSLQILDHRALDLRALSRHAGLMYLYLSGCCLTSDLSALRELPDLRYVSFYNCTGTIDLSALVQLHQLNIRCQLTTARGAESIPPERLQQDERPTPPPPPKAPPPHK